MLQWVVGDALRGSTLEIPDATGIFGLALNLAPLNEQKKFAMCFFCRFNCKVGLLTIYTWSFVITPRNGRKENNIKLFHPYKWHSLLTTGFWGRACRHLHKTFQQYTLNKNNKFKKIMLMLKGFDNFKVDLKRCLFYCKFLYVVIIFVRSLRL